MKGLRKDVITLYLSNKLKNGRSKIINIENKFGQVQLDVKLDFVI